MVWFTSVRQNIDDTATASSHLTEASTGFRRTSVKVRHNFRGEKFTSLCVVPSIGIDHQVDAGVLVLSDQVDGLAHRTDKAAQRSADSQPLALRHDCGVVAGEQPGLDTDFSIVS
jgi:hypothetical protein